MSSQARAGAQAELTIDVFTVEQKNTVCWVSIAPSPTSFLEIVFERAGYVAVDYEANVRLVDAHAERVGGRDDAQVTNPESFLNIALVLCGETRVVAFGGKALLL